MTARRNVPPSQNRRKKSLPPQGEGAEHSEADEGERLPPRPALWKCRMERKSPPQPHTAKVRFHLIRRRTPPASPWGGSLGRGGTQSFSCSGFALILLKRIYSFCIIFRISTNCYPHGFKKPLSVTKSSESYIYHLYLFAKYSDLQFFHLAPERRPLSWKKAVLLPPLPAGCIWAI